MRFSISMSLLALFTTSVFASGWEGYGTTTTDDEPTVSTTISVKNKVCKAKSTSAGYNTSSSATGSASGSGYPTGYPTATTTITVTLSGYPTESTTGSESATSTTDDQSSLTVSNSLTTITTGTSTTTTSAEAEATTSARPAACGPIQPDTCTDAMANFNNNLGESCANSKSCFCLITTCQQQVCVSYREFTCGQDCDTDSDCPDNQQCMTGLDCNPRSDDTSGGNACMAVNTACLNPAGRMFVRGSSRRDLPIKRAFK